MTQVFSLVMCEHGLVPISKRAANAQGTAVLSKQTADSRTCWFNRGHQGSPDRLFAGW